MEKIRHLLRNQSERSTAMDESKKNNRYEDAKKFVRYSDGAKMYSMGMTKFLLR